MGFPSGSVVKNLTTNAGDAGSIPASGRSPGEENSNVLQYSCLGNPMSSEVTKLDMSEQLNSSSSIFFRNESPTRTTQVKQMELESELQVCKERNRRIRPKITILSQRGGNSGAPNAQSNQRAWQSGARKGTCEQ